MLIGLEMTPQPGWHGYWSNPGENGLAPVVQWTAPEGVHFGPLEHPAPTLLRVSGMTSFVHEGPHTLLARMRIDPRILPGASLPITANVSFAACSEKLCVPEHATLGFQVTAGDGKASADAAVLRGAAAQLPRKMANGTFDVTSGKLVMELPPAPRLDPRRARFFPDANGFFDPAKERVVPGDPLRVSAPADGTVPTRITGVLTDGSAAYRLAFDRRHVIGSSERQPSTNEERVATTGMAVSSARHDAPATRPESARAERRSSHASDDEWAALAGALLVVLILVGRRVLRTSAR